MVCEILFGITFCFLCFDEALSRQDILGIQWLDRCARMNFFKHDDNRVRMYSTDPPGFDCIIKIVVAQ